MIGEYTLLMVLNEYGINPNNIPSIKTIEKVGFKVKKLKSFLMDMPITQLRKLMI